MQSSEAGVRLSVLIVSVSIATQAMAVPAVTSAAAGPRSSAVAAGLAPARKLCADSRWSEGVTAFEELARLAPDDATVLSELGWAAFQVGDHAKSRSALERSLALAKVPAVKPASLCSVGRVEEAAGRRDLAPRHYRASLALRDSSVVDGRLRSLQDEEPRTLPLAESRGTGFCTDPIAFQDVCACVLPHVGSAPSNEARGTCTVLATPSRESFRLLLAAVRGEETLFLLEEHEARWSVLAELGSAWSGRSTLEETHVEDIEVGGRRVLKWTAHRWEHHETPKTQEGYNEDREIVTVCVVDRPRTRCPLVVTALNDYEYYWSGGSEKEVTRLRIDLGEDGVAFVVLEAGEAPSGLLGPHRLW